MRGAATVAREYDDRTKAVDRVIGSGVWTGGREAAELSNEIAAALGVEGFVVPVANGTVAIVAALAGLGVKSGSTVAVPSYGFPAADQAIRLLGASPFYVDVDPNSGLLDVDFVVDASNIVPIDAIVAIDHEGNIPDFDRLLTTGIPVVEDAAAAFGSTRNGRAAGTLGTVSTLSFNQTKKIRGGEGGAVVTGDFDLAFRIDQYVKFGEQTQPSMPHRTFAPDGMNFKMGELEAAMARVGLDYGADRISNAIDFGIIMRDYLRSSRIFDAVTQDRMTTVAWHKYPMLIRSEAGRGILSAAEIPVFEPVIRPSRFSIERSANAWKYHEDVVVIGNRVQSPFDGGARLAKEYVSRLEQKELEHEADEG